MKRLLRSCLVMLVSLVLPLSGIAGLTAAAEPCPMKAAGMAVMGDMGRDCCQDVGRAAEHGKPCKPGQECRTASIVQLSIVKPPVTASSPSVALFASEFPLSQAPSGVWRPPRV